MTSITNKIEATDTSISKLLKDQKFYIDYFQREYRWQEKHIKTLVEDLCNSFQKSYTSGDKPSAVAQYQAYYLGPVVFSINPETNKKSIIDGQQRITSITLFLIYLKHLQKEFPEEEKVSISNLIFSVKHRVKSFNMTDESREECLRALFEEGTYQPKDDDDETVVNMVERYEDIDTVFPEDLRAEALPYFIDWFIENVVIVEIKAYSDENAYTIFETMNDRGLNLTPTEMLKGYVLSRISNKHQRNKINDQWKKQIQLLHEYGDNSDQDFFQAWFRGKYAVSIRPGKAGSENQDFELIGSRFHNWFKENHEELFHLSTSDDFVRFFSEEFPFFVNCYIKMWDAMDEYDKEMPHVEYIGWWGIAESLQDPLMLASLNYGDSDEIIKKKMDAVARFVETFTVRRSVNFKKFGQTAIKYTMFNNIKEFRNKEFSDLMKTLKSQVNEIPQEWEGISDFSLHKMNRKFVKHLLSRISNYVDRLIEKDSTYISYRNPDGKQFEIEHLWANKFEYFKDEFDQENEFIEWRNSIGALILLPRGTNQSFGSDKYESKLEHYLRENTYAQTLHPSFYTKNPNFLKSKKVEDLQFRPHPQFKSADLEERQELVKRLCEEIWSDEYFDTNQVRFS